MIIIAEVKNGGDGIWVIFPSRQAAIIYSLHISLRHSSLRKPLWIRNYLFPFHKWENLGNGHLSSLLNVISLINNETMSEPRWSSFKCTCKEFLIEILQSLHWACEMVCYAVLIVTLIPPRVRHPGRRNQSRSVYIRVFSGHVCEGLSWLLVDWAHGGWRHSLGRGSWRKIAE